MDLLALIGGPPPGGPLVFLIGGAIGVLVVTFIVYRAGRKVERARQDAARHKARDVSDEIEDAVSGRSPAENRERLKRWSRGS